MSRPDASEALSLGFDHRAEVIPAEGSLLLKVDSDRFQVVVGEGFGVNKGDVNKGDVAN